MPTFKPEDLDDLFDEDFEMIDEKKPKSKSEGSKKKKDADNKKGCLIGCGTVIALFLLFIVFTTMIGSGSNNSNNTKTTETSETESEQEDYSTLSTEELIKRAKSIQFQLEGKLDSEYMTPEEKVTEADRVNTLCQEYSNALESRKENSIAELDVWQAFGAIQIETSYLKDYAQTGSQEDHDKFIEQSQTVNEFINLAQEQLDK